MLFVAPAFLALASLVSAQNATTADTATVQANFNNAELVPDLLEKFNPEGTVDVAFSNGTITIGEKLAQSSVSSAPTLTVTPGSSAADISTDDKYTVFLIDADVVGTNSRSTALTRHWLVNGASLSGSDPYTISYDGATTITDYAGPAPAAGSGSHRYTFLVYLQPSNFSAPSNLSTTGTAVGTMYLNSYVTESGLGALVAANYFQVENGVATSTVAETTAVDTASLGGATTSASGASTTSATGTSGSSSSSSAAAASSSSGAAGSLEATRSLTVGAMGIAGALIGALAI